MQTPIPHLASSEKIDVTVASTSFTTTLVSGKLYRYICDVASWITQGSTPTATAGTGSMYVSAGQEVWVHGGYGGTLAALRAAGDGKATLTPIDIVGT
jgi:streptogramin lyase